MKRPARIVAGPTPERPGANLTADAPTDTLTLHVEQCAELDEHGGVLLVVDEAAGQHLVRYASVDDAAATIELVDPLPVPMFTPARVELWDETAAAPIVEYVADIIFEDQTDGGDAVPAIVTAGLLDRLTNDVRGVIGTAVTVERAVDDVADGDLYITEIDGQQARLSLENVDVDTAPPDLGGGDTGTTVPPASSPAVTVTGFPDGLGLQLVEPPEAGARVQYHLSADQTAGVNFLPSSATAVGAETVAGVLIVDSLPDGSAFVEGVAYYARAVAVNDLGEAGPGPGGVGMLNRAAVREMVFAMLVAGFILTGRIQIGRAYIDADEGFVIPNPDGSFSRIPFNGDPIQLLAEVVATSLTVQGMATFLGVMRIVRRAVLGDGISAPADAPTVAAQWPAVAFAVSAGVGLAPHHSDASQWVTARSLGGSVQLVSARRAGGGAAVVLRTTSEVATAAGLVLAGGRYWLLGQGTQGGQSGVWKLVGMSTSDPADVVVRSFYNAGLEAPTFTPRYRPALGVNETGGSLLLAYVRVAPNGSRSIQVETYTSSTAAAGNSFQLQDNVDADVTDLAWIGQDTYNAGAQRVIVQPVAGNGRVWSGSIANPTRQAAEEFPRALGGSIAGMCFDGSRLQALTGTQVAAHSAARTTAQQVTIGHAWAGNAAASGSGAVIETNLGPTRAVTIPAQAQMLVTTPTPPEADLPDPSTANRAAVYALTTVSGSSAQRRQVVLGRGARAATLDVLSSTGRIAAATGAFSSSPGDLVPERGATDADKRWRFTGAGYGRLGDLEVAASGDMVAGTKTIGAIRQDSGWLQLPLRSGYRNNSDAEPVQYRRVNGEVKLRGPLSRTSGSFTSGTAVVIGDLPAGFRPDISVRYGVAQTGQTTLASMLIGSDGSITVTPSAAVNIIHIAPPSIPL